MTGEMHISAEWDDDWETAYDLAKDINTTYNQGDRCLTCVKFSIDPDKKTADILVGYTQVLRSKVGGSKGNTTTLREACIEWPTPDSDQSWDDPLNPYKHPKAQLMRGYLISEHLKAPYLIYSSSTNLKAVIKDGEPMIEEIKGNEDKVV